MVRETLTPDDLAEALRAFAGALHEHREVLNRLNVYPVPDGDTGTNMALTVDAVVAELPTGQTGWEEVSKAMGHGSLMGARGNSGVILSQLFRGFADVAGELGAVGGTFGPAELAQALRRAAHEAYAAVGDPVEGTMLTVAAAAGRAGARRRPAGAPGGRRGRPALGCGGARWHDRAAPGAQGRRRGGRRRRGAAAFLRRLGAHGRRGAVAGAAGAFARPAGARAVPAGPAGRGALSGRGR